jgi:hypothetical protein
MKQKIIITMFLLTLFSLLVGNVSAEQTMITINDASGSYEETVDVSITISNADDVGSLDMALTYDPTILQVDSVSEGDLNKGMISSNTETEGILSLGLADQNGITGDGEIAVVSFTVMDETGSSPLIPEDLYVYDVDGIELDASAESGTFTVSKLESDPKAESPGFELMVLILGILCFIVVFRGRKQ